jgi:hypothetical protein
MQCACAMLSSVACPALQYFLHYFTDSTIFEIKLLNIKYLFRFSPRLLPDTFLILRGNEPDFTIYVHRSAYKVPLTVFRF